MEMKGKESHGEERRIAARRGSLKGKCKKRKRRMCGGKSTAGAERRVVDEGKLLGSENDLRVYQERR